MLEKEEIFSHPRRRCMLSFNVQGRAHIYYQTIIVLYFYIVVPCFRLMFINFCLELFIASKGVSLNIIIHDNEIEKNMAAHDR